MRSWLSLLGICGIWLTSAVAVAQDAVQFSAETRQSHPRYGTMEGRIYMGDGAVRREYTAQGQPLVEIVDFNRHKAWLLAPQQGQYQERDLPASGARNPCDGMARAQCRQMGTEQINGRPAQVWQVNTPQGSGAVWVDQERGVPLREQMPDGTVSELRVLGSESFAGRPVERWQLTRRDASGQTQTVEEFYDPELKVVVREEFPDGSVRELNNIQVGPQPARLFQVPAGMTRVEAPQRPPGNMPRQR